jgi:three-Cys-motif partner protein
LAHHNSHFDDFPPHTRLKHAILNTYIVAWAMKLFMSGITDRLAIVDAFAGPGRDGLGHEGSPLIVVRRARDAMNAAKGKKAHLADPKVLVFAIEERLKWFQQLAENVESIRRETPELVHIFRGTLPDHLDRIQATIGGCPTFYFLDPFGIKGLDAGTYSKALSGPHNEIFALFANIGAVRLHGVVTAERANPASEIESILDAPSLFPDHDTAAIESALGEAALSNEALDASIPASRAHLSLALGGDEWISEIAAVSPNARADTFLSLFGRALSKRGARYVLTVPMRNASGQRIYALVHASKSRAAFITMKEAVSSGLGRSELSAEVREAIKADLSIDAVLLVNRLARALAGRTTSWAHPQRGLKVHLLAGTPLFHFQAEEVKTLLKNAGILRRIDGKEVCVFPNAAS